MPARRKECPRDTKAYFDLVNLGQDRCRAAALSVMQLIDSPDQQVALLLNVAVDMVRGAAQFMCEQEGLGEEEALAMAVSALTHGLGVEKYFDKARQGAVTKKQQ